MRFFNCNFSSNFNCSLVNANVSNYCTVSHANSCSFYEIYAKKSCLVTFNQLTKQHDSQERNLYWLNLRQTRLIRFELKRIGKNCDSHLHDSNLHWQKLSAIFVPKKDKLRHEVKALNSSKVSSVKRLKAAKVFWIFDSTWF